MRSQLAFDPATAKIQCVLARVTNLRALFVNSNLIFLSHQRRQHQQRDAGYRINRSNSSAVREALVTEFLRDALAVNAVPVPELDEKARAGGLLGERQSITTTKVFKRANVRLCASGPSTIPAAPVCCEPSPAAGSSNCTETGQ